jgi:Fe-S cluster biosynthesis and repair protein YggX
MKLAARIHTDVAAAAWREYKQTHLYNFLLTENFFHTGMLRFVYCDREKRETSGEEEGREIWNKRTSVLESGGKKVQQNNEKSLSLIPFWAPFSLSLSILQGLL